MLQGDHGAACLVRRSSGGSAAVAQSSPGSAGNADASTGIRAAISPEDDRKNSKVGGRISYSAFRAIFIAAWLLIAGGVVCAGAHIRVGFILFVFAGVLLAFLGAMLALNSGKLSDRMVEEVAARWGNIGKPLAVSRFGGLLLLLIGFGATILGAIALAR